MSEKNWKYNFLVTVVAIVLILFVLFSLPVIKSFYASKEQIFYLELLVLFYSFISRCYKAAKDSYYKLNKTNLEWLGHIIISFTSIYSIFIFMLIRFNFCFISKGNIFFNGFLILSAFLITFSLFILWLLYIIFIYVFKHSNLF